MTQDTILKANGTVNHNEVCLTIHRSNLFHPLALGIKKIARAPTSNNLAVVKELLDQRKNTKNPHPSIIEIYSRHHKSRFELITTIYEYERVTGIHWINDLLFLTVTKDQTINIYSMKTASKISSLITDYGSILCSKFFQSQRLLITGTIFGHVATYRILGDKTINIEPLNKMVKVNNKICVIDAYLTPREVTIKSKKTKLKTYTSNKRKRDESSDESEEEDQDQEMDQSPEILGEFDITIYGGSLNELIVWSYHKKFIIDTIQLGDELCHVTALLVVKSGDILIGDSTGTVSIFDPTSLTCKQSITTHTSSILCMASNKKGKSVVISGQDPTVIIIKRKLPDKNVYTLCENMVHHTHDVNATEFLSSKEFVSGSDDGNIVRCLYKNSELNRVKIPNNFSNQVQFFDGEMLLMLNRSLVLWKIPQKPDADSMDVDEQQVPGKLLQIKTKSFTHAMAFSKDWVAYASRDDVRMVKRESNTQTVPYRPAKNVPEVNLLTFCYDGKYLAAAAGKILIFIDTRETTESVQESSIENEADNIPTMKITSEFKLKRPVKQMVYLDSIDALLVFNESILTIKLSTSTEGKASLDIIRRIKLDSMECRISSVAFSRSEELDSNLFILTSDNCMLKYDVNSENIEHLKRQYESEESNISGLPAYTQINGMVKLSNEHCILYNDDTIYRLDMNTNSIVSCNSDYKYIIKMDNLVFGKPNKLALAEMTPGDYQSRLPLMRQKRKFGN